MKPILQVFKEPEYAFLILALLAGGIACFLIPPLAGFDEITHLARIWEMSDGYMLPNQRLSQGPYLPMAFVDISYRNQYFYNPVDPNFFARNANKRIDWNSFTDHQTRSVYFPLYFLPQAFAMGLLGRFFDAPVLWIVYVLRFIGLSTYILLSFFAIRVIPAGKWALAALGLAPMAVTQAATISFDTFMNGAAFLFIAWALKLAMQAKPITRKQTWITAGMAALLLAGKVNAVALLLLLLPLFWKQFDSRKASLLLAASAAVLFAGLVIGWNLVAYSKFYMNQPGYGAMGQLASMAADPFGFAGIFFRDLWTNGRTYLIDWVGIYPYGAGIVPLATYPLFGLLLAGALLLPENGPHPAARLRIVLALTAAGGYALTVVALYLSNTPIHAPVVAGVQGRYFLPIAPALVLALVPRRAVVPQKWARLAPAAVWASAGLALFVFLGGAYLSFFTTCGTALYTPGLCYQPVYKNWDPNAQFTFPISQGRTVVQSFTAVCSPLESFRVWSARPGQPVEGETRFSLKDSTGQVLVSQNVANSKATEKGWLEITFPLVGQSQGKQFSIEVTSSLGDPSGGLALAVTSRKEYEGGKLRVNDVIAQSDLVFQYGCGR